MPWDNLWCLAVIKFRQPADVAWGMRPSDVWALVDFSVGGDTAPRAMSKEEFEGLRAQLDTPKKQAKKTA